MKDMAKIKKLISEKSSIIHQLNVNQHLYSAEEQFSMAQRAADLEGEIAQIFLKKGRLEDAVTNLVSQASLLLDLGAKKEAKEIFQRASDLTQNSRMKAWIQEYLKEQKLRRNPQKITKDSLLKLRKELIKEAQYIYDEWNQNSEGFDDHFGEGGICTFIAEGWQKILRKHGIKSKMGSTPWDQGDHQFLIVKIADGWVKLDLPFNKYEKLKKVKTGWLRGQKLYFKKLGVKFKIGDLEILPIL